MIDNRGRTLTPCRRKVAEREVRLQRAKWIGPDKIRLRFDPFAYRYIRLKVLARDQYTCYWCGGHGETMDHVIPWSRGGRTSMENCICACEECNGGRGDMPPEEFAKLKGVAPPRPLANTPSRPLGEGEPPRPRLRMKGDLKAIAGGGGVSKLGAPGPAPGRVAPSGPEGQVAPGGGSGGRALRAKGDASGTQPVQAAAGKVTPAVVSAPQGNQQPSGGAGRKSGRSSSSRRRRRLTMAMASIGAGRARAVGALLDPYQPALSRRMMY